MKKYNQIEKRMQRYLKRLQFQLRDGSTISRPINHEEHNYKRIIRLLESIGPIVKA